MTENQLRQRLRRDDELTDDEIEDYLSEWASDQYDNWKDSHDIEPIYPR